MFLPDVRTFLAVATAGSLSAAARQLDVVPMQVSRRIAALEEDLGVRLFHRTTRSLTLTAEGEAFKGQPIKGDTVSARRSDSRSRHQGRYWIGGYEKAGALADSGPDTVEARFELDLRATGLEAVIRAHLGQLDESTRARLEELRRGE